jgi:hypothetical protein
MILLDDKYLKDPETLGFSIRSQLHLSFPNWSPLQSFSNSTLHQLVLGLSSRLPQLSAFPAGSSSLSELFDLARYLYWSWVSSWSDHSACMPWISHCIQWRHTSCFCLRASFSSGLEFSHMLCSRILWDVQY